MKNPTKLLRTALVLGMIIALAPRVLAQEIGVAVKGTPVNISELAADSGKQTFRPAHKRLQKEPQGLPVSKDASAPRRAALAIAQSAEAPPPAVLPEPSPDPSLSFLALPDSGEVTPPDTFGAVGTTHLVVACASEIRITDRLGGVISTQSQEAFWAGVGANIFDTRVVFDPYGQRFIMTAAADPAGTNPRLCIAVSATSNPTGVWYRWSEDVDAGSPIYADSPTVGFNKTWIVVQANMFHKTTFAFVRSEVFAYNKANLYANGAGQRTKLFFDFSLGGSQIPATMYDSTNALVYFVKNWNGRFTNELEETSGFLRIFSLSGGIGSERLNITNALGQPIFANVGATWADGATNDQDILRQLGTTTNIYAGDSRIQNVHFRDGLLYTAQTVFLPSAAPTRAAVQWWSITASSGFVQHFGRVEDPGGTNMFAYPSIAANQYQDVLLGYSRFSPNEYPSSAYSFRQGSDPADELRGEVLLKAGQAVFADPVSGQNRWGDWSATTVDPVNDVDLWTIQEYAAPLSGNRSRWGTWWGRVSPPVDLAITMTDAPDPVPSGNQVTYAMVITNKMDEVVSGVRVQDTLPPGMSFVSATPSKGSCGHTNGVLSCFLGTMTEFERATITMTVTAGLPGFATNTATVFANGPDFDAVDNAAVVATEIVNSADLSVQGADSPDPVHVGNILNYSLSISNRGPSAAAGVVVTSTLPVSVSIGTITASQGLWNINGNVITFTLGSVNNGTAALLTIAVTANAGGMITNQVRVAANTFDTTPANNTVAIATRVNARPVINPVATQTINEDVSTPISITISDAENAAGSLQLSATSSNQGLIPNANIVPGGSGGARNLTITSAPNQFGSNTTVTVTVTDLDGASTSFGFTVNVAAVNDPPTITDIPNPPAISEDGATAALGFTIADIDSPIGALTLSGNSSSLPLVPIAGINFSTGGGGSRFVTVTPATNRSGAVTITVTVNDGALSTSDTFVLNVNAVNDPPVISGILNQSTPEDTATANIAFTVGDVETLPGSLTVTATSSDTSLVPNTSAGITLVNNGADRTIRLTPALNQAGVTTITMQVSDGSALQTTTFNLTVTAVNDRPTLAQPANVTTSEDGGLITVNLSGIGTGAANESQALSVRASTDTPNLVQNLQVQYVNPSTTGMLTFDPVANAFGTAIVNVVVSDGVVPDDFGRQFQVVINPLNDPPTIHPIDPVSAPEDSGERIVTLTGISAGPANESDQSLTFSTDSSAPGIVPNPQITHVPGASTATLRFTPVPNANGLATITVTVSDGRPLNPTATQVFQITVDPVNDLPTISQIADRTISEDGTTGAITFNFRDVEPGALSLAGFSSNQSLVPDGNVLITGTGTNRTLTVTPAPNEFGAAVITVRVTDGDNGVTDEAFVLMVTEVNDPPSLAAIPNPPAINEDATEQTIGLAGISKGPANETGQTVLVTAASSNPTIVPHPTVNYTFPNPTGFLTYTPAANATGSVVITVTANDQQAANNLTTRTFTVQITSVNDAPTISILEDQFTDEDVPAVVTFTIGDVETLAANLTLTGSSSIPELVPDSGVTFGGSGATRTVTVRPFTNEFGSPFIFIRVRDGAGEVTESGFVLNINEVDDPPLISTIGAQTIAEDTQTGALSFWINDVETSADALTVQASSSDQQLVPNGGIVLGGTGTNRNVRVTPASDANGLVNITLSVSDGNTTRTSQMAVTVNPINDSPELADISPVVLPEDAGQQLLALVVGPGAANETGDVLAVTAISSVPALIPHPVGTNDNGVWKLRFTPAANASGSANITVTVNDGRPLNPTTSKSFTITVQPMNDLPTLNGIADVNLNRNAAPLNVTLNGISAGGGENQPLNFTTASSNPSLVPAPVVTYTSGATGTLRLVPAANSTGSAQITVRLSDGQAEVVQVFTVTVHAVNEPPTISTIGLLTTPEDTPVSATFMIADPETFAARLTLSGTSSNTTLISNGNITFNGSDSNRSVTIIPTPNMFGTTTITIAVGDGTNTATTTFDVTVNSVNDAPTLNPLNDLSLTGDPPNQTISLSGVTSGAANESQTMSVRVTSSNTSLVPAPSSATTTSFILNPANSGTGSSLITVTVWDNGSPSNSISRTFTVYIRNSSNSRPTLVGLTNQTTLEDTPITVPFTVGDSSTPVGSLNVGAYSSNLNLVPTNGFVFGGSSGNRTVTITPLPDRSGTATITVWVTDAQFGYTASNFVLTVTAVNDRPTISSIAPRTIDRGAALPPVPFTISDAETPPQNLTLSASSSDQTLVPNANVILGGSGTNRSVMAYPLPGQTGSATITVTVTDATAVSTNTSFVLTVRALEPATLAVRRSGPNLELSWPTQAGIYTLQGRDHLHAGTWNDIIATPMVNGTNYVIPQPAAGPRKFFRLRN